MRLWSGIHAISAALERKVWCRTDAGVLYPNFFIALVGPSGCGKTKAIEKGQDIIHKVGSIICSPSSVTKERLYEIMKDKHKSLLFDDGGILRYCAMSAQIYELGVFLPPRDNEFMMHLCDLYDCRKKFEYETKKSGKAHLECVFFNLIAGTTADWFKQVAAEVFTLGITSRLVIVYSDQIIKKPLWGRGEESTVGPEHEHALASDLKSIHALQGEFKYTPEAAEAIDAWYMAGMPPKPADHRLAGYASRRIIHLLKLCMIASASSNDSMLIGMEAYEWAKKLLLATEQGMPGALREVGGNEYVQNLRNAVTAVGTFYMSSGRAMPEYTLREQVFAETSIQHVQYIMDELQHQDLLDCVYPGAEKHYLPKGSKAEWEKRKGK